MYLPNEETVVTVAVPEQSPYTMIADAIRRGAKSRPQCAYFTFAGGRSCVIGALAEGLGYKPLHSTEGTDIVLNWIKDNFPVLRVFIAENSYWLWRTSDFGVTREEIADRVEAMARE